MSWISRFARAAIAATAAFALPALAAPTAAPPAASRLDDILARGALLVGTTGDYKPFTWRSGADGPFIGLDVALAADLAASLGVRLEIVPTTWATMMPDLAAGRFDVAMGGVSISLERQKTAFFSIPTMRDGKTPIARCTDVARYQTLDQIDRPDVRVIVNPGGTNERFVRARAPHATLVMNPDNVTIFDRLVAGDADVMITDAVETRLQQRLHPQLCAVHPDQPFDFSEKAVLMPRDAVLKAYVDQWLHQSLASGAYARLDETWLAYPWALDALRALIDARLLLAPDVARYKWTHHGAIEDLPREAQVIDALARQADARGIPLAWAQAFFRAQIEASKTAQRALFDQWRAANQPPFADAPDLATITRPKIDRLTGQLMQALADSWPVLGDPARHAEVVRAMQPMQARGVSTTAVDQAVAPFGR